MSLPSPGVNGAAKNGTHPVNRLADLDEIIERHAEDATVYHEREALDVARQALADAKTSAPAVPRGAPSSGGKEAPKPPPCPPIIPDIRAMAKLLAFLGRDTPERSALCKAAGLAPEDISTRLLGGLRDGLRNEADDEEATRFYGEFYRDLPHPSRDDGPLFEGLNVHRLADVEEREVEWLWWQRVPIGYMTLISGDPDLGKTWLILDILARTTTGRPMPDGSANPYGSPRDVLWVSAEDADADIIKPRFLQLGGDPERFHSLRTVLDRVEVDKLKKTTKLQRSELDLARHTKYLDNWLALHPLVTVVALDPLAAFTGKTNGWNNNEVRNLLTPLSKLAEARRVTIVGNNHLNKGDDAKSMYRGQGSIAFVAAARSSWLVTPDPEDPKGERRLFTKVKCNPQKEDVGNLAYRVGPNVPGAFLWEESRVETSADQALRSLQPDSEATRAPARAEAMEWLAETLKDGPMSAPDVTKGATAEGICRGTLFAAKKALGVRARKVGGSGGGWEWSLPASVPLDS